MTERERRLALHLPVEVNGEEAGGNRFREHASTLNISGGGICFETTRHLLVGTRLELEIRLPPALQKHFEGRHDYRVRAVVCRVEHFEGQPVSRIGARFLNEIE